MPICFERVFPLEESELQQPSEAGADAGRCPSNSASLLFPEAVWGGPCPDP